jgi:hypothetical protein
MTEVVVAALGTALALTGVVAALRPRTVSPRAVIEAVYRSQAMAGGLDRRIEKTHEAANREGSFRLVPRPDLVVARVLVAHVENRSQLPAELKGWLTAADRSLEDVVAQMVLGGLCGVAVPLLIMAIAVPGGAHLPLVVPVWVGAAFVITGAIAPVISLRAEARAARRAGRAVVASFLDLVVLCLAGGMGIEGALHASAAVAEDPLSVRLRQRLLLARDSGATPWQALGALGRELGLDELAELAAAVGLAGTEGARIRTTLSAKAASIRQRQLSEAETEANTITERLFLPGTFLLLGFLLFVGYPAVSRILGGF